MKSILSITILAFTFFLSCSPATENVEKNEARANVETPVSEEEKAINQLVADAYKALNFKTGTQPDYEAIKALFTAKATLVNMGGESPEFSFIDDFIAGFKAAIDAGELTSVREWELGGETESFGKIGHRISASNAIFNENEEAEEKNVNSFQVVKVDGKWLINSIVWDVESEGMPIPVQYLTKQ